MRAPTHAEITMSMKKSNARPEALKSKFPNALKHGACSRMAILPGEDPDEFIALLEGLLAEWEPQGPTEGEAVYTIAACIWRKRRIQRFITGKIGFRSLDPGALSFDPDMAL